ncbi:fumarylacetoacetate hydrolase family protein [Peredibacter sp. HCB2-198]|uniref:fumarylacetoacetate hydrolase family protein n=1 Tax=Peredibacter sp. HCB2-198 TaxID=3383025 RepID=UPI0038B46C69
MKVVTYKRSSFLGVQKRLGLFLDEKTIIDVNLLWQADFEHQGFYSPENRAAMFAPKSLAQFLRVHQDAAIPMLQDTLERYKKFIKSGNLKTQNGADIAFHLHDVKDVKFDAPLDEIAMYRDFYAHEKHVKKGFEKRKEEVPPAWYEIPAYYKGGNTGFIGQDDIIPWPFYSQQLDYELELGVVIGRDGKNVKAKDIKKHIFGFTILNDVSARDIQRKEMSIRLGPAKGKDWCSIMGPVIVTYDEFNYEEPNLLMTASVNGEEWSRGQSGDSHYSWGEMIEHMGMEEWIRATDFIGSGTVGTGCGLELDKWIKPGDKLELSIEKIGTLKNIVGTPNPKP